VAQAKGDGGKCPLAVAHAQAEVCTILAHRSRLHDAQVARCQGGLGVPLTKGLQQRQGGWRVDGQICERDDGVHEQPGTVPDPVQMRRAMRDQPLFEGLQVSAGQGDARRQSMPTPARQQVGILVQRSGDVYPLDAARRAAALALPAMDDERWAVELVAEAAGDQSNDPLMEFGVMHEQDRAALGVPEQVARTKQLLLQQSLALGVHLIQPLGQLARLGGILGKQEIQGEVCARLAVVVLLQQPTGGVQPRPQAEGDVDAVNPLSRDSGGRGQGVEAGAGRGTQARQAALGQRPVLIQQGHDVGHRAHGHQVKESARIAPAPGRRVQRLDETIGDAHAG